MTAQKTPLKTKANTAWEIRKNVSVGMGNRFYMQKEWVLLSDVEPLELEIKQLKTQIETAKQILKNSPENTLVDCITTIYSLKEVFGEKTET